MFFPDKPIKLSQDDLLGRKKFSHNLAQAIMELDTSDTYTIGILGKWGSGKTSLINMVLEEIRNSQLGYKYEDKLITLRFEPWNFSNADQLLNQFFVQLSDAFRTKKDKALERIGDAIEQYAGTLELTAALSDKGSALTISLGKMGSFVRWILRKCAGSKDVAKQKEQVIDLLDKQPNRILIVIDDLDRLNNEQIRCIFQMVTSIARFPKTTYLLAFDKDVVVKALEKVQEGDGEEYLRKIIQVPIRLPDAGNSELDKVFVKRMNEIKQRYNAEHDDKRWQYVHSQCVYPLLGNLRDIYRLANMLEFKMALLASEIDFGDMIAITALEMNDPNVFEWIRENRSSLVEGDFDEEVFRNRNRSSKEWEEHYRQRLLQEVEGVDANCIDSMVMCLAQLFPAFGQRVGKGYGAYDENQLRKINSIGHAQRFDRYFQLNIEKVGIKKSEILQAVYFYDADRISKLMLRLDEEGNGVEFLKEIKARIDDMNGERAREMIDAFIKAVSRMESQEQRWLSAISATSYAEHMVFDLAEKIPAEERLAYFVNWFAKASPEELVTLAAILNMMELGFGRVGSERVRSEYRQLLTLEELIELEQAFCKKAKSVCEQTGLFELSEWRIVYRLLEYFDQQYTDEYLRKALEDDQNIIRYLCRFISKWHGTDIDYEIHEGYDRHLTKERILQAIESLRVSGKLFDFPREIQEIAAAFYLNCISVTNYRGHIRQEDVDRLLNEWQG